MQASVDNESVLLVVPGESGADTLIEAHALDRSKTGVMVLCGTRELPAATVVGLGFRVGEGEYKTRWAEVRWSQAIEGSGWVHACRFKPRVLEVHAEGRAAKPGTE